MEISTCENIMSEEKQICRQKKKTQECANVKMWQTTERKK